MRLPAVPLARVLLRVDAVWSPSSASHHLIYATTGAGKSTLIRRLMSLCPHERLLMLEPKRQADAVYVGPPDDLWRWGRPVTDVTSRFGFDGQPGGGPESMWFRLQGSPDRADTARRFDTALEIAANEGSVILVLDDVKEICKQLGLAGRVESILSLGRSAGVCVILSTTETSYVAGRAQGSMIWCGYAGGGLPAAKAAADLLGWRGRDLQDVCAGIERHQWIYQDSEDGSQGAVLAR